MVQLIAFSVMLMRVRSTPVNLLIVQVHASCEDADDEEKESFYEMIDQAVAEFRKGRECLIIMGSFNRRVRQDREGNIIRPYGLGVSNVNG